MLQASELQFQYTGSHPFTFPPITVKSGEKALITGNSGSGKTTWVSLLSGLIMPTSGKIIINNTDIQNLSSKALDSYRANNIGMVFQKPYFISGLSALENVALAQTWASSGTQSPEQSLEKVGLLDRSDAKVNEMSLGELQRLSVARAIMNTPKLIIADEPTSSLDDKNAATVMDLLELLTLEAKCALLVVSHDARLHNRFETRIGL